MTDMRSTFSREQLLDGKIPGKETKIEIRKTTCGICLQNCGINAYVKNGTIIKVEGTAENPDTGGTLCAKGAANRQYVYHTERIQTPLLKKTSKGSDHFIPISWEEAMDTLSTRLLKIREASGPESVIFFTGFPKRLRPFLQRLAHGFGSPNYCSESSTCYFATAVANHLNYGCAGYPDVANTRCLLVWSCNPFHSGTSRVRGLLQAIDNGMKVIEVGPLISPLTGRADIHLRLRPGTSGALALGMAHVIIEEGLFDREFVDNWTTGFSEYSNYVREFSPMTVEAITSVPAESIIRAARLFAESKPAAIMSGASPTVHHTNAVQNHRAITALIGLTGNFDRKGGNYVQATSYYHQPTGLLTREREFEQVRPFDEMPPRIGQDVHPVWCHLVNEAQSMHIPIQINSKKPYPIRAMVGFGVNYRMWPGSDYMRDSLKKLDFMVDVDLFLTDTARLADLVLPACSSFEKHDLRIWPSRYAIWTRPAIAPVGEARSDIDIIIDMADKLGLNDPLLSKGHEACLDWMFEPAGFKIADIKDHPEGCFLKNKKRPAHEKYKEEGFQTPSGKMEFASSILKKEGYDPLPKYTEPTFSPVSTPAVAEAFPLVLTTGARLPMFFHSRTFRLPWTRRLRPDPMLEIHPEDAENRGIAQGDVVNLSTSRASITVKADLTSKVPVGVVNMLHGYPEADVNLLIEPDYRDPISGFPGFKALLCEVSLKTA